MSKIVFLHVPKTGGTSVHEFIKNQFSGSEICPDRFNTLREHSSEYLDKFKYFSGHYDIDCVRRIPGEKTIFTFFRDPKERILSLYYFWKSHTDEHIERHDLGGPRVAKSRSLIEFLKFRENGIPANIDNYLARILLGKMYCGPQGEFLIPENEVFDFCVKELENIDFIGFMDSYNEDYKRLIRSLGFSPPELVPHSNKTDDLPPHREYVEKEKITSEVNAELSRLTRIDQLIYNHAATLRNI